MISIHASAKEATFWGFPIASLLLFQSTPPRRRRPHLQQNQDLYSEFQSTPPRRRRRWFLTIQSIWLHNFNPRLREGGDNFLSLWEIRSIYFNPRLREGGDVWNFIVIPLALISIHASAKEATLVACAKSAFLCYFNPRLREGGDPSSSCKKLDRTNFNPRLREGGDFFTDCSCSQFFFISIHASAKEATWFLLLHFLLT